MSALRRPRVQLCIALRGLPAGAMEAIGMVFKVVCLATRQWGVRSSWLWFGSTKLAPPLRGCLLTVDTSLMGSALSWPAGVGATLTVLTLISGGALSLQAPGCPRVGARQFGAC